MTLPDYQALMLPILEAASKGEATVPEASDQIAGRFGLSEEQREQMLPSGKQRVLHNRLHWAKFYLTKAGLLANLRRGVFTITDAGRAVLANPPPSLDVKYLMQYPTFRDFYTPSDAPPAEVLLPTRGETAETPEEVIEAAHEAINAALRIDLLDRILQNTPAFFEQVIIDLLIAMGYGGSRKSAAEKLGKSGDGGIDGVINEDILGLDRVYVQAKRYSRDIKISRPEIQAFTGSLVGFNATKGVFVTTSSFSQPAADFVSRIPQRVVLIDGERLGDLMIAHGVGVRSTRSIEIKRLDEDFFSSA